MSDNVIPFVINPDDQHDDGGRGRRGQRRRAARAERIGTSPTSPVIYHVPLIGELAALVEAAAELQGVSPETVIAEAVRSYHGADR